MNTRLHHFAHSITRNNLELVSELFERLGCEIDYRRGEERWCLIRQGSNIIQLIETDNLPVTEDQKANTHIGFLSDDPRGNIDEIEEWLREKNVKFRRGKWSDQEMWFDLPEIFVNFVVEIMHESIVKK